LYPLHTYSGRGDRMDVVALGTGVLSCGIEDDYYSDTGTSQATPLVAALAGLIHEVNPALSAKTIKYIIVSTADGNIYDCTQKYINAQKAIEFAIAITGDTPPIAEPSGILLGQLTDIENEPINDGIVTAYKYDVGEGNLSGEDISEILLTGGKKGQYYTDVETNKNGEFELVLVPGNYYLNVSAEGYESTIIFDIKIEPEKVQYVERVLMLKEKEADIGVGIAQGYIRNALNGRYINGAEVVFRDGWNNKYGDVPSWWTSGTTITSNSAGYYSMELPYGNYTAEISKAGYIVGYVNIVVSEISNTIQQNFVITPILAENEYRVVLQWGKTPADLDAHLTGPTEGGNRFHIYYNNTKYVEAGKVVAKLDVDDINSYGPETITVTLKSDLDGIYRYSVHDFFNIFNDTTKALSLSGAKVMLYKGNSLILTASVPINKVGNLWTVFEIDGEDVRQINSMSFENFAQKIE